MTDDTVNIIKDLEAGIQRSVVARKYNKSPVWVQDVYEMYVHKKEDYERPEFGKGDYIIYGERQGYENKLVKVLKENKSVLSKEQYNKLNNRHIKTWFVNYLNDKRLVSRNNIYADFETYLNFNKHESRAHEEIFKAIKYRFLSLINRFLKNGMIKRYNTYTYEVVETREPVEIKKFKIEFETEVNEYKMTKDLMRYIIKSFSTTDFKVVGKLEVNGIKQELRWDR